MMTRSVSAADLHIGDLVVPVDGPARRITLHRLQGAPPVAVVAYAGQPGHQEIPATEHLTVVAADAPAAPSHRID